MPSSPTLFSAPGAHLRAEGLSKSYGAHRVLTDVTFTVAAGERAGLIGENGSGKSTLLRELARLYAGSAGLLHQEPPFELSLSVGAAIETAVAPIRAAGAALTRAADGLAESPESPDAGAAYAHALEEAELLDVWEVEARIAATLAGLGLAGVDPARPTGSLSGGQLARLCLAWLLLHRPQILLLDEPTNHLDDAATQFLTATLRAWPGPVLFASHDRAFLDEVTTTLIDLDPDVTAPEAGSGVRTYTGNYTDYLSQRLDDRERWERQYAGEQAELKRLRAAVRTNQVVGHESWTPRSEVRMAKKFYADRNARVVARRVNDSRGRLAGLEAAQVRKPPAGLTFRGLTAGGRPATRRGALVLASEVALEGRLSPVTLAVEAQSRLLITGANGHGKSTLLRVLARELTSTQGSVHWAPGVTVSVLSQDVHLPDPQERGLGRTTRQAYADLAGHERAEAVPLATLGLIAGRDESRPVAELSVGQRRRLELAVLLANPPSVLLLDEPTNHLSLELVTVLEAQIPRYPGAVVVASHDRWLRRRWGAIDGAREIHLTAPAGHSHSDGGQFGVDPDHN